MISLLVNFRDRPLGLASGWAITLHTLFFYTVQSNILAAGASFMLALRPERRSKTFGVLLLVALTAISMTGIVFNTLLAHTRQGGLAAVGSDLAHIATPLMTAVGWLLFGPSGALTWRLIPPALVFPLAWIVATLVRGALVGFYPYFFLNVRQLGYAATLLNVAGLGLFFVAMAAAFIWWDRRRG